MFDKKKIVSNFAENKGISLGQKKLFELDRL